MKKPFYQTIASAMEIPADLSEKAALVEITGQFGLKLQNYLGIIEYSEDRLLIQCKNCRIEVCGKGLFIDSYSREELVLSGRIEYIHYY
ncbi:MAG: YabP/YqfC family sporulation protein [Eubacteriales bacterium]|nr:YabP/YqfC family sporulation protein [Eubacteriales bacterium]